MVTTCRATVSSSGVMSVRSDDLELYELSGDTVEQPHVVDIVGARRDRGGRVRRRAPSALGERGRERSAEVFRRALARVKVRRRNHPEVPAREVVDPARELGLDAVARVDERVGDGRHHPPPLERLEGRLRIDDRCWRRPKEEREDDVALPAALQLLRLAPLPPRRVARPELADVLRARALPVHCARRAKDEAAERAAPLRVVADGEQVGLVVHARRGGGHVDERVGQREGLRVLVQQRRLVRRVPETEPPPRVQQLDLELRREVGRAGIGGRAAGRVDEVAAARALGVDAEQRPRQIERPRPLVRHRPHLCGGEVARK
mmetsp:Transcript_26438/g.82770  ORF Transcript_26438/g.82770 Transcript_26438/m.82770 type:complete len:319 (+) Transcript_26438:143-1099(+)